MRACIMKKHIDNQEKSTAMKLLESDSCIDVQYYIGFQCKCHMRDTTQLLVILLRLLVFDANDSMK